MVSNNNLVERVAAQIAPLLPAHSSILIGLSGGVDSVVLLHLLHKLAARFSWQLSALHVHHGISPNADAWSDFCADLCARHLISLHIERVDIAPLREHGVEAAARKLRHAAFAEQSCDFVALAHHADDQAETLLLQLLRGAGVRGASAMPVLSLKEPLAIRLSCQEQETPAKSLVMSKRPQFALRTGLVPLVRPLLHCSREEILAYATAHQLHWIEDESNADDHYPRNFLRHRILPLLGERFPAYRDTLARSAQHFAEASSLLDELAQQDGAQAIAGETLAVTALQALSRPRAKNLLRYFLHRNGAPMPPAVQLDDMLQQLCGARQDAGVCITYGGGYDTLLIKPLATRLGEPTTPAKSLVMAKPAVCGSSRLAALPAPEGSAPPCQGGYWQVRRYQGKVYALHSLGDFDPDLVLQWSGEAELDWPALKSRLRLDRKQNPREKALRSPGISLVKLQRAPVTLRLRHGGEALRPHLGGATRSLKNLLQEHHVPPWQRDRLPLLYCGDELVCVPSVAIAAEYLADEHETAIRIELQGARTGKS